MSKDKLEPSAEEFLAEKWGFREQWRNKKIGDDFIKDLKAYKDLCVKKANEKQSVELTDIRKVACKYADKFGNVGELSLAIDNLVSLACKVEIEKAYIDGTNSCHKAFQPLLKSALKEQREETIKNLNVVHKKLHSKQYKDASIHLGTIIYCLENPSVESE